MTGKLKKIPIKKKDIQKKILTKYPRVKREYSVEEDEDATEENTWKLSKTIEEEGFVEVSEFDMWQDFPAFNEHVFYKSLREIYGWPDPVTFFVRSTDYGIKHPELSGDQIDEGLDILTKVWSYLLELGAGAYLEVTKGEEVIPDHRLWLNPQEIDKDSRNALGINLRQFISLYYELLNIVDKNYIIENEQKGLAERWPELEYRFINNLYSEYLKSADGIIEIAEELYNTEKEAAEGILHFVPKGKLKKINWNKGTLFISAAVFYMMALEAFINILYRFRLKPEYEYEQFKRSIRESCLELSILNLPVYCEGFINKITPEDDAIKNWKSIRSFRNNLIHANLTIENESMVSEQDGINFFYLRLLHHKYKVKNHTSAMFFRKAEAKLVRGAVQGIVANIIDKMDEDTKRWTNFWINKGQVWPYKNL